MESLLSYVHQYMLAHPESQNMTYFQHLCRAWGLGFRMGTGCCALLIHGLVPKWFQTKGSETIRQLYDEISPSSPPPSPSSHIPIHTTPLTHRVPSLEMS